MTINPQPADASSATTPAKVDIDQLINLVRQGGSLCTGVDIFSPHGKLLLENDIPITDAETLERTKRFGIDKVAIIPQAGGGLWDPKGVPVTLPAPVSITDSHRSKRAAMTETDIRLQAISEISKMASVKYAHAKKCIKQVLRSIQENDGEFDFSPVADTVSDLLDFISNNENSFSYLTREIFCYDDYLYNHAINVCTIGAVVMKKLNENFSTSVNSFLSSTPTGALDDNKQKNEKSFRYFQADEMRDIAIGFFMHDLGKVMIDTAILNKNGRLTDSEFEVVKSHVTEKARRVLEKNGFTNPYVANICFFHHSKLYEDEPRCYPERDHTSVPAYVKVCKLADIYDAMTSKRAYKDAHNPVGVVADIFNQYAKKDPLLQYILHSFVSSVGIYPPGSVVALSDGRQCYVMESQGPVLLPITNKSGATLADKQDPIVMVKGMAEPNLRIDRRSPPLPPLEAHKILPHYLRKLVKPPTVGAAAH